MSKITFPGGAAGGGGAGVSDHGGLAGLSDDDHSQYVIGDYSRSSDHLYAASGHVVSGLAVGASGRLLLNDYTFIVETAGVSGIAMRRSDGRVSVNSPSTFSSALTVGGDGIISLVGSSPKLDSNGNLTFEDGGGASFSSWTTSSLRVNNNDFGALFNLVTDTTTKPALTIQAMAGQTAGSLTFEDVDGNSVGQVSSGGAIGASGGITFDNHLTPSASGESNVGSSSNPVASGIFDYGFWIRGANNGQSPGFDRNGWNIRTIAMNGSLTNLESNSVVLNNTGSLLWSTTNGGFTSPANGEVLLKNADGSASGHFVAGSGTMASGLAMRAPNGSGWTLKVANDGGLTTEGPFVWNR